MARANRPPPQDWERIDRIFTQALDLAPGGWPAFLDETCEGDKELRSRVADLLRLSLRVDDFLEEPLLEVEEELAANLGDRLGDRDAAFPMEARIGPYRIIDTLGRGGAGTVYLAERVEGDQKPLVALKVLRRGLDTDDLLERFTVERQILATLDHPDVARLLDAGATEDGRPYLVMEHVDGEPITEHCGTRGLSVEERLGLFVRVARAVHHAHGSLIVHRDLKPTNVLVAEDGTLKLLDFGIAKLLDPHALAGKGPKTRTGTRLLTPGYASPEQRRGEPVTPASDIYQLGLLLYELLTGVAAYEAAGKQGEEAGDGPLPRVPAPSKVLRRIGDTDPVRGAGGETDLARRRRPDTGSATQRRRRRELDRIVMTALEAEPEGRYPTAAALAADVERVLQGQRPRGAAQLPMGLLARKLARRFRTRRRKVAAAAMALGLVGGAAALAVLPPRPPPPPTGTKLVAIFPFAVHGSQDLQYLEEGITDLLSTRLDGMGFLRALNPDLFLPAWRAAGPRETGVEQAVARQVGAGHWVRGSVLAAGGRLRISAAVYARDLPSQPVSRVQVEGESSLLTELLDELAVRLFVEGLEAPGADIPDLASLTTTSLPALLAYLEGEDALRQYRSGKVIRDRVVAAEEAFGRAVSFDTTFALAYHRLAIMAGWNFDFQHAITLLDEAHRHGDRLPLPRRLLIRAERSKFAGQVAEAEELFREVLSHDPNNLMALQGLGTVLFFDNPRRGRSVSEAREPLERILEHDKEHRVALNFLNHLALREEGFSAVPPGGLERVYPEGPPLHWRALEAGWASDGAAQEQIVREAEGSSSILAAAAAVQAALHGMDLDFAARLARVLGDPGNTAEWRASSHVLQAVLMLARGRLNEARAEFRKVDGLLPGWGLPDYAAANLLPFAPSSRDSLERLRSELMDWDTSRLPVATTHLLSRQNGLHSLYRSYLLGLVRAQLGEFAGAEGYARELEAWSGPEVIETVARTLAPGIRAEVALARGAPGHALRALETGPLGGGFALGGVSIFTLLVRERFLRAELLRGEGRLEEALRWYGTLGESTDVLPYELMYLAPAHRAQAEIHDQLGNLEEAAEHYARFIELWKDCDPELRPLVSAAEEEVARIREEIHMMVQGLTAPRPPDPSQGEAQ